MKFVGLVGIVIGVLCGCPGAFSRLDCTNKMSLQLEQEKCFTNLGLSLGGVGPDEIQNVIQKDPRMACGHTREYKTALRCAMDLAKGCLATVGQSADILPDVDRLSDGISYICGRLPDIDVDCATRSQTILQQCTVGKALSAFSGGTNFDVTFITCKAFEITEECIRETLDICAGQTMEVYAYFTQHYLTPPACRNDSHTRDQGITTMAPMTTAQLLTTVPALPHVSCYSESSIMDGQRQCFEREGITLQLPQVNLRSSMQAKQSYLDAILANNKDIHSVCRDLPRYQSAMGCAMETARQCMPAGYKNYLPGSSSMKMMLSELCDHADDINQECITSKASELFDCGYRKGTEHRVTDAKSLLCNAFKWNVACQMEVLPPCGCKTTQVYVKISKEYLNPPACARIIQPIPQCHAGMDEFISTGGATLPGVSTAVLTLATLLIAFFSL